MLRVPPFSFVLLFWSLLFFSSFLPCLNNGEGWYKGCYSVDILEQCEPGYNSSADRLVEPASCCKFCLQRGFEVAVLRSDAECFCANTSAVSNRDDLQYIRTISTNDVSENKEQHHWLNLWNYTSTECTERCSGPVCLPYGNGRSGLTVYRSVGPYIYNTSVTLTADRVLTGKEFLLEVSGYLASSFEKTLGLQNLTIDDFTSLKLLVNWTRKQSVNCTVTVQSNGYFTVSLNWTFIQPGHRDIWLFLANPISEEKLSKSIEVLPLSPACLDVKVERTEEDTPSCIPFETGVTASLERVFMGTTYTFVAFVTFGIKLDFYWLFSDDNSTWHTTGLLPDGLNSSVNHTFTREGVFQVMVNLSNPYNWTQKTLHMAVVQKALQNLSFNSTDGFIASVEQNLTFEIKLSTTVHQLLLVNISFGTGKSLTQTLSGDSPALSTLDYLRLRKSCQAHFTVSHQYQTAGNYTLTVSVSYGAQVLTTSLPQQVCVYEPISAIFPDPIWKNIVQTGLDVVLAVMSTGNHAESQCQWNITKRDDVFLSLISSEWGIQTSFRSPNLYLVSAMCFNPISASRYSREIEAQEAILDARILGSNPRYVQRGHTITLNVTVRQGSNITAMWAFNPDEAPFVNFALSASYMYTQPGLFLVNVTVQNNVSSALVNAEVIVQDAVEEIVLDLVDIITVNHPSTISIITTTGTNISLDMFFNDTLWFHWSNCLPRSSVELVHTFNKTGLVDVVVSGSNQVSTYTNQTKSVVVEELHLVDIEVVHKPVLGEDIILAAKLNGHLWQNKHYIYQWTLPNNRTRTSGSPVLTYSCRELGLQEVHLTVSNMASSVSIRTAINVTQGEEVPLIVHPSNALLGEPVPFTLKTSMTAVADAIMRFGDGTQAFLTNNGSINHRYISPGIYNINATANGKMFSSMIVIQEALRHLSLEGPHSVPLSTSSHRPAIVSWTARLTSGSNYVYHWMCANGTVNSTVVGPSKLTLQFAMPSIVTVMLRAENEFGYLWANMTTTIEYTIFNVSLSASPTTLNETAILDIVVEPQQQYIIAVDFGDGTSLNASSLLLSPVTGCFDSPLRCSLFSLEHSYAAVGCYTISIVVSNTVSVLTQTTDVIVEDHMDGVQVIVMTPAIIRLGDYINATVLVESSRDVSFQWEISCPTMRYTANGSSIGIQASNPGTCFIWVSASSPLYGFSSTHHAPFPVTVRAPIGGIRVQLPFGINYASLTRLADGSYATQRLSFSALATGEANFSFDFGDGSAFVNLSGNIQLNGIGASALHQYKEEGIYMIKVTAYNEFYSATREAESYYVEMAPNGLVISMNPNTVYRHEAIVFTASLTEGTNLNYTWNMGDGTSYVNEGPIITHTFSTIKRHNVTVTASNRVGSCVAWINVSVLCRIQTVSVFTNGTAFSVNFDIVFWAVTNDSCPAEFVWNFGDGDLRRTTSRQIAKRYIFPSRYNVRVNASNSISFFVSDIHSVTVQRRVVPNRLVTNPSVLVHANVTFECRKNSGTSVAYRWNFGDGTVRTGRNNITHVYRREGEFTVEVLLYNNVSSAVLKNQIFVVREPCQPPRVKHMGPARLQVRRYQSLELGVTFETAILCNISQGLLYHWSFLMLSGRLLLLPPSVDVTKQTIRLPRYLMDYGNYTALAKVQVIGSVVYSNYTVPIEVSPSLPISVIAGGTHLFISKASASSIFFNGSESYDPDFPGADMRFHWRCAPASRLRQSCFKDAVFEPFHGSSPTMALQVDLLDSNFDQFLVTLTVSSTYRTSSEAQVFLSISSDPNIRSIQLMCNGCEGNSIKWNQGFSIQALCERCKGMNNISYAWKLNLINATETTQIEVPFCRVMDLRAHSSLYNIAQDSSLKYTDAPVASSSVNSVPQPTAKDLAHTVTRNAASSNKFSSNHSTQTTMSVVANGFNKNSTHSDSPVGIALNKNSSLKIESTTTQGMLETVGEQSTATTSSTTSLAGILGLPFPVPGFLEEGSLAARPPRIKRSAIERHTTILSVDQPISITDLPSTKKSSDSFGSSRDALPPLHISEGEVGSSRAAFESHYSGVEEGGGASGSRQTGFRGGIADHPPSKGVASKSDNGDNLIDTSSALTLQDEMLMLDWRKSVIHSNVFQSYTTSGISNRAVAFSPFVLKPSSMYMLEVSIASDDTPLGKAQLYFSVQEKPHGMTCEVQPQAGYELKTEFSIFCTSGKEDLYYEFSYSTGNSTRKSLYKGRDIQYYFSLPAGDPNDRNKVKIFIEVTNRYGSRTRPCPVTVTVQPSVKTNLSFDHNPQDNLFVQSLKKVSTLLLTQNHIEIRNYITILSTVLNRLYTAENSSVHELQSKTRNWLISSVCSLPMQDQEEINDIVLMLADLTSATEQMVLDTAILVMNRVKEMAKLFVTIDKLVLDANLISKLVQVLDNAMAVSASKLEKTVSLLSDGIKSTQGLLLKYVSLGNGPQFYVQTKLMEIQTTIHHNFQNNAQGGNSTRFYLPDVVDQQIFARTGVANKCYISQIIHFRKNPYVPDKRALQLAGEVVDLSLYTCTSRSKISIRGIASPIKIEFEVKNNDNKSSNHTAFSLFRDKVNFHHFSTMPEHQQEALQITVEFAKDHTRAFPVLLLVRYSQKPTPTHFNMKQIHNWDGETVQMFIPAASLKGSCFLALMDANFDRKTKNKYLASVVNYNVHVRWTQCLYWDELRDWRSDGCYPQQGTTAATVNCRCNHLTTFTVASRSIEGSLETSDVSQFMSVIVNLVPCIVIGLSLALYVLLAIACKVLDRHEEKKNGYVLLQDNALSDQQVYAIIVDTGFRSRAKNSAKVHIILHGEDGVSETRELCCPDKPLFERNSSHTFIMSLPDSLGPIWKLHIWHNNGGNSPSWYLSHVIVKDLTTGISWFFHAECWLAVDEGDGKVECELTSLSNGLGFKELLYCRFTEYLEDFHVWGSVYSLPSHSCYTRTQRLTICLVLLLGYMCINTWLIHWRTEEYTTEFGLIEMSTTPMVTGIFTTLAFLPVVASISLLFRLSKKQWNKDSEEDRWKSTRGSQIWLSEDRQVSLLEEEGTFESYLSWEHFQQWAHEAWKKKYERDSFTPSILSRQPSERSRRGSHCFSDGASSGFEDCSSHDKKPALKDNSIDAHSDYSSEHLSLDEDDFHVHRVLPHWCIYLAWGLCVLTAFTCVVMTGTVGLRFGPTKCLMWLHALFFSVMFCIFFVQPFLIFVVASVVAWKNRERSDFFSERLCEATKYQECEPGHLPKHYVPHYRSYPHDAATEFEKSLAARQRARYLRLARPLKSAQLKAAKGRIRKTALIQQALREFIMYAAMLFLLLFTTFSKFSNDEYLLNHAIRTEFTRNLKNPFTEIKTANEWWDWSFSTLLDGLYWDTWYNRAAAKTQAGPVGGKCFLVGSAILRQLSVIDNAACVVPSHFITQIQDCQSPYSLPSPWPEADNTSHFNDEFYQQCGKTQCYKGRGSVFNLGRSRSAAYSMLLNLRKTRWINRNTRAVIVEFALYNPPTNLFTSVSLLAELPPSGGIISSSFIESVHIYHMSSVLDYLVMASEMAFLGLVLVHFCFQLCSMSQRGLLIYLQEPWNWIELSIIVLSLCSCAYLVYRLVLAVDIIDRFHRGFFRVFVDLSFISSWDQYTRSLHGIILFLLLIKCINLLRIHKAMAPCVAMLRLSCSSVIWTLVAGTVFIAAYSSLGYVLFTSKSHPFSSIARSGRTILFYFLRLSEIEHLSPFYRFNQVALACYYGTFFIIMTVLWTGMLRGVLASFVRDSKKSVRSKHLVAFRDVTAHTWEKVLSFVGRQRQKPVENISVHGNNSYLDEFENLIDELLFRLNAFSNSLHHSLPAKPYPNPEEEEEEEENPLTSGSHYYCSQGSENPVGEGQQFMGQNVAKAEEELLQNIPEKSDVFPDRQCSADSGFATQKSQRSCVELRMYQQHPPRYTSLPLDASFYTVDDHVSNQSGGTDFPADQKSMLSQCNEKLLSDELLSGSPAAEAFNASDSGCLSLQGMSPSPQGMRPEQMELADTSAPVGTAQSQRLESRLNRPPRCASASPSAKSRKPLKRSPTTVIEPLDRNNAEPCTADYPSATDNGILDSSPEHQHLARLHQVSSFKLLNRAENLGEGKMYREDSDQPTLERNPDVVKKLQNVKKAARKLNPTTPDEADSSCDGQDLHVSIRQCW